MTGRREKRKKEIKTNEGEKGMKRKKEEGNERGK